MTNPETAANSRDKLKEERKDLKDVKDRYKFKIA
jgi:hypothetical protein